MTAPVVPGCPWLTEGGNECPVSPCQCRPRDPDGRCRWCGSATLHDVTPGEWCPRLAAVAATGCATLQALEKEARQ